MSASERLFRLLLRLYPADFRDEFGEGLIETYLDRLCEESAAAVWFAALRDSIRNGLGERVRPAVAWRRAGDWGRDMEMVGRRLRQKPIFVVAVLATLTVGLGTVAVVYTAVDKILLEPLPYKNANDLYMIWSKVGTLPHLMISGPSIAELQKAGGVIEGASGIRMTSANLLGDGRTDPIRLPAMIVSANLFDLLGVRPALGRTFRADEEGSNGKHVVVVSDGLWKRLGADPGIVGTELTLSSTVFTVIGVMPPEFAFNGSSSRLKPEVYIPFDVDLVTLNPKNDGHFGIIRARHGTSPEDLRQAVEAVGRFVDERDLKQGRALFPIGLQTEMVEEVRPALVALSFAAVFLVLVLTVNLASLLLARAAEREREFAVSRALGASGPAVVRAMLLEGGLLGLFSGMTGTVAGIWGTRLLVALGPIDLPRREAIAVDSTVGLVVTGVGLLLGLSAAAVPATWAARVSLASLISGIAVRGSASSGRMRRGLIIVQVALSLVLLSAGGLVVRSFQQLLVADPGFRPKGVLTFQLAVGSSSLFPKEVDVNEYQDRVEAALQALPGVTAVGAANQLPLSGGGNAPAIEFPGAPGNTGDRKRDSFAVGLLFIRPGYINAIGMRLLEGRDFEPARHEGMREAIIDAHLAKQFFPNSSPLGATLRSNGQLMTIVGVVDQARLYDLHTDDNLRQLYVRAEDFSARPSFYALRTDGDPRSLIPEVRTALRQIDRRVPISDIRTMDEIVAERRSRERLSAVLISGLALGALLLVSMGLFGMISGSVARRRGELAVRMALGATHGRVIRLVVSEGSRLISLGLLIGIPGIYMAGEALQGVLVGVSPYDTLTISAVVAGLVAVSLLTCYVAARRVTRIAPNQLLREGG
jgi:putative ABC transport system permease protein